MLNIFRHGTIPAAEGGRRIELSLVCELVTHPDQAEGGLSAHYVAVDALLNRNTQTMYGAFLFGDVKPRFSFTLKEKWGF